MKKKFSLRLALAIMLLLGISVGARADEGVVLTLKSGQEVAFAFSGKPRIATGENLDITMPGGTKVSYEYAQVRSIKFGSFTTTGIEEEAPAETVDVSFRISDGVLHVCGLPKGESVSVYNLSGQRQAHQKQTADGTTITLPLSAKGVLVVRTSTGVNYKVMNP